MLAKRVKIKILFLITLLLLVSSLLFLVLKSLEDNVVYFFSPSEIYSNEDVSLNKKIRIGGLVKKDSIKKKGSTTTFIVTDLKKEIIVTYIGITPNLFAEEKGVVAEGMLSDKKYFIAETILAKHDENYMPPEVSKALEKSKY
jgi:cytochrome c-type biogenesis protein CcmE|tara:strand:- start:172 stop:600 length:429 start_codon:yes stop_codon:yes gene_type:complete